MLAGGLGLKGLSQSLFALVFSYSSCGRTLFESEESLAKCFGYSREHVCLTMNGLVKKGLIHRGARHEGLLTYDFSVDISAVARMLGPPNCNDPEMLKAFKESLSQKALKGCEKTSQQDVRKSNTVCEETSHNKNSYNSNDNFNYKDYHGNNRNGSIEIPSSYEGD